MTTLLIAVATLCAGAFAGAAIYINVVEHPARMAAGTALALTEWRPSYRRATLMQAPLALIGGLSALVAWLLGAGVAWGIGGLLLLSVVPVTFLVIMPTNRRLLAVQTTDNLTTAAELLARWNRLHAVRSILSSIAFLIFVSMLARAAE